MKRLTDFILSPSGVILIPVIIIMFVLLSNLDPILDRMGFETRSHLKSELAKSKYTIALLKEDLHELKDQQAKFVNQCLIKEEIVTDFVKETEALEDYIKDVISTNTISYTIKGKDLIIIDREVEQGETIDEEVVHEYKKEPLNNNNIVAINKVYNELFGG